MFPETFHKLLLEILGCVKFYTQRRNVIPAKMKVEVTVESLPTGDGFVD
jgi:hypothetical protein